MRVHACVQRFVAFLLATCFGNKLCSFDVTNKVCTTELLSHPPGGFCFLGFAARYCDTIISSTELLKSFTCVTCGNY